MYNKYHKIETKNGQLYIDNQNVKKVYSIVNEQGSLLLKAFTNNKIYFISGSDALVYDNYTTKLFKSKEIKNFMTNK